jgi:hypothetical protein
MNCFRTSAARAVAACLIGAALLAQQAWADEHDGADTAGVGAIEASELASADARTLRERALELEEEGRLAAAWRFAEAAAQRDPRNKELADALATRWLDGVAVSVRLVPGAPDEATARLVGQIRAGVGSRLVRWTENDAALLSGQIGRERVLCEQRRGEVASRQHGDASYVVEQWTRTCTVGLLGSLRVGSRSVMLGQRLHASVDAHRWDARPELGLVGGTLQFEQDDRALERLATDALAGTTADSIERQVTRFVKERAAHTAVDAFDTEAVDLLLERFTGKPVPAAVALSERTGGFRQR